MSIEKAILNRFYILTVVIILLNMAVIWKIIEIQIISGEKWRNIIQENRYKYKNIKATRGSIFSDREEFIATSLPFYKLAFDPTLPSEYLFSTKIDSLAILLSRTFKNKSATEYATQLVKARKNGNKYVILNERIPYYKKTYLEDLPIFRQGRLKGGIIFKKRDLRFKPFGKLGRRVIGLTYEDSTGLHGKTGLEYSYDEFLKGRNTKILFQKLLKNRLKPIASTQQIRTENGADIYTTLNIDMQQHATETLESALVRHQAAYGCVLIMEVKTGAIKAMVNLSRNRKGEYIEDYNYAIASQGVTEPGSTFKTISVMAALEEGKKIFKDSVDTGIGEYAFYPECIMRDVVPFKKISLQEAFEKSSNIGISRLTYDIFHKKPDVFLSYIKKFGLLEHLDFQIRGMGKPFINKLSSPEWSGCSLPWIAIGYEIKLSPLQMLAFYNTIANDGKMIMPFLVKKISRNHKEIKTFKTKILRNSICSQKTLKAIQSLLEGTVLRGTARNIYSNMYAIAGKTGTTHKIESGKYTNRYYTSFAGYFPSEDPMYTAIVVIDDPKGEAHFGGNVSAPVFKKIADEIYIHFIHPQLKKESSKSEKTSIPYISTGHAVDLKFLCNSFNFPYLPLPLNLEGPNNWIKPLIIKDTILWKYDFYAQPEKIINVEGMTLRDALYILENQKLKVIIRGKSGKIMQQSLPPGTSLSKERLIQIALSH